MTLHVAQQAGTQLSPPTIHLSSFKLVFSFVGRKIKDGFASSTVCFSDLVAHQQVLGASYGFHGWSQWVDATLRLNPTCIENKG